MGGEGAAGLDGEGCRAGRGPGEWAEKQLPGEAGCRAGRGGLLQVGQGEEERDRCLSRKGGRLLFQGVSAEEFEALNWNH